MIVTEITPPITPLCFYTMLQYRDRLSWIVTGWSYTYAINNKRTGLPECNRIELYPHHQ